jgi:hypothetical protein
LGARLRHLRARHFAIVDVTEMERVKFVIKGSMVIRNDLVVPR